MSLCTSLILLVGPSLFLLVNMVRVCQYCLSFKVPSLCFTVFFSIYLLIFALVFIVSSYLLLLSLCYSTFSKLLRSTTTLIWDFFSFVFFSDMHIMIIFIEKKWHEMKLGLSRKFQAIKSQWSKIYKIFLFQLTVPLMSGLVNVPISGDTLIFKRSSDVLHDKASKQKLVLLPFCFKLILSDDRKQATFKDCVLP